MLYHLTMEKCKKKQYGFAVNALRVVQEATEPQPPKPRKEPDYKTLGHKGGLKGGKARASKLTLEQRKEIATKAAKTRWAKGH